jgi:hypothetical protein
MCLFVVFMTLFGTTPSLSKELVSLENYWALSSLHPERRHRLEGVRKKDKTLEVSIWYEDSVVTKNVIPDREIFCRFLHAFLYGKNTPRQARLEWPPAIAFRENPDVQEIEFSFFTVRHQNKPSSPFWEKKPQEGPEASPHGGAQLRVVWTREERAIPFIRVKVSRAEWMSLSEILKSNPSLGFSAFNQNLCAAVHSFLPRLSSSFSDLD